jgi:DNA-binding NtrC family response regulator
MHAPRSPHPDEDLLGDSSAMEAIRASVRRLAPTPCNVLVCGGTGTGKEVVAQLLHRWSPRAGHPFVPVNCSAVPETLFESELFGYARGAFTGATASWPGKIQAANGGTVFLDEIGELSLAAQPKLLRVIEQREVQRLGTRQAQVVDVRWVSATNRDLADLARQGLFRADLFYRLNVSTISIPPLREHPEDVALLARAFLQKLCGAYGRPPAAFTPAALERLTMYPWPGNVRELRNAVESSLIESDGAAIDAAALPLAVRGPYAVSASGEALERCRLVDALAAAGGNKARAARALRCSRMTLYRRLHRHNVGVTSSCNTATVKTSRA